MRTLPLLLALCVAATATPAATAQADAPLALVTEASEASRNAPAGGPTALDPLSSIAAGEPLEIREGGTLALQFADGLHLRFAEARAAVLSGSYADGRYIDRGVALDSGLVRYAFSEDAAALSFRSGESDVAATVAGGEGGVLVDAEGLRLVVTSGEATITDPSTGQRLAVTEGQAGVSSADGVTVRTSTLAERDRVAEPTARRRRLLVPGTDDEGNARTFIIEWEE